ncbi:hypothetical protein [Robertmurraya kyonggiensis]|uniref:Sulfurtransferase n=1 Tax=Robertmurraya kyonggiensis TaxID=1037680 RepID=A0A4U1DAG8_9BACI|nr:hypothetical protein [Robertmurraya kyonggiensis]TKC19522.1 hypothetical protein FA727_08270 [Robertmurraya kyonggiensis]
MAIFGFLAGLVIIFMLLRYLPVFGVHCIHLFDIDEKDLTVVDVRDYNRAYKDSFHSTINIPVAYLNRYFHEIPGKKVHVVAANPLEKNISIRFLRKKGYHVKSYTLTDAKCDKKLA